MKLELLRWNPVVFGSFLGGVFLFFLIPVFWVGYPLLLIAYAAPFVSYVLHRNGRVHDSEKVFTPDHLRWLAARWLGMVGIKIAAERRDAEAGGAPVKLFALGGADQRVNAARLLAARQSPGLRTARELLADALARRASAVLLDYSPQGVAVRHMIDGVWLPQPNRERETADPALEAMKLLCGLNPQDRQSRQAGAFGMEYVVLRQSVFDKVARSKAEFREKLAIELIKKRRGDEDLTEAALQQQVQAEVERQTREKFVPRVGVWTPVAKEKLPKIQGVDQINPNTALETVKRPATLVSQRVQTGERALIQFETRSSQWKTLADLGMRDKMQEQLMELLHRPKGFVLFSAVPAGGLRTTLDVLLRGMDRFLREFVAVEDEANPSTAIENIPVTAYKASAGESPASVLPKLFRTEPNVVIVRDLVDGQTVSLLCRETVQADRIMIGSIRAKDAAEAMLRTLMLKAPPQEFAAAISGVLCQRLVRKLCETCKEPYSPATTCCNSWAFPRGASGPSTVPVNPNRARRRTNCAPSAAASATRGKPPCSNSSWSTTSCERRWQRRQSSTCSARPPERPA